MEKRRAAGDRMEFWQHADLGGLEVLRATYARHRFAKHTHDTFSIGLIEGGANGFFYRGATEVAGPGMICVVNPGEVHTGGEAGAWSYWNLYPPASLFQACASELVDRPTGVPFFGTAVIDDPGTVRSLREAFVSLTGPAPRLEREVRLLRAVSDLILRHSEKRQTNHEAGRENARVRRVREYLEAHVADDVSLAELSTVADLSAFHLLRVFREAVGLPPHAYLTQLRVRRAKALLLQGVPIVEAAADAGFADQAHLTRRFKEVFGITPGRLRADRNIVQDGTGETGASFHHPMEVLES